MSLLYMEFQTIRYDSEEGEFKDEVSVVRVPLKAHGLALGALIELLQKVEQEFEGKIVDIPPVFQCAYVLDIDMEGGNQ